MPVVGKDSNGFDPSKYGAVEVPVKGNDTDFDPSKYGAVEVKKKVGGNSSSTGSNQLSSVPQSTLPEEPKSEFEGQSLIDLAAQSDELSKQTKENIIPDATGRFAPTKTQVPDEDAIAKSKKIDDYISKSGFNTKQLNNLFSGLTDEYYTALGTNKEKILQDLKDNPIKTEQQIASAKWQIPVQQNIINTEGQQGLYDFQNMRNAFADKSTDFATKRKLAPQLLKTIRLNTPASEMSKVQANFATDAAQAYGDVQDNDPTLLQEQAKYPSLNINQVRALDYLKDVAPVKAQGFAAALVDPSKLVGNYDAQAGQEEKLKRLDEIGISLKENSINEKFAPIKKRYDELYNLKQNGIITPDEDSELSHISSIGAPMYQQLQDLKNSSNELLMKYPKAGVNDAGLFAQELLGQKHTGLNWLALKTGEATSGAVNSIWDLVSQPFRSEENSNIHQLSTLGDMKISGAETNLTQANQLDQTFKPTVSKDLQSYIDDLKNNTSLTDKQKSDDLTIKLMQNPDKWQRTPIEGGKANIRLTSMLYGTGQLAATLAPYILAETATGGGASASIARKFTSNFVSMMGTSFHDSYAQAIDRGEADPYGYALRTTTINSAAMAGAGTADEIRGFIKLNNPAADKLLSKMTDSEIMATLRQEPKAMSLFRKSAGIVRNVGKGIGESAIGGIKSAAKISPYITGGQIVNDIIDDNVKNPQDYAKQAAIEGLKFAVMGTTLGSVSKLQATDMNKAALYEAGKDPESFLQALKQKEDNGSITPEDATQVRNNIANAQQVFKKVPFVDGKGKPLGEKSRRDLLFLKMQENDIESTISKDLPESLQDKMQQRLSDTQDKIDKIYKGTLIDEPTQTKTENKVSDTEEKAGTTNEDVGNAGKETAVTEDEEKLINEARDKKQLGVYGSLDNEEVLKEIAKQAQNIQQDGSKSDLISDKEAYEQTIRGFGGNKELIDVAINKFPEKDLLNTEEKQQPITQEQDKNKLNENNYEMPSNTEIENVLDSKEKETGNNKVSLSEKIKPQGKGIGIEQNISSPKKDIGQRARDEAAKYRSGEKKILPSFIKSKLPEGTKVSGIDIDINKAWVNALDAFATVHDATKDFAKAIDAGFKHLKDWFDENKVDYDEKELKDGFEKEMQGGVQNEGSRVSGIAQRVQESLGLKPYEKGEGWTKEEALSFGLRAIKEGIDPNRVVSDQKYSDLTFGQKLAVVQANNHILTKEMYKAEDALKDSNTPNNVSRYQKAKEDLINFQNSAQHLKTESSKAFVAQQGEIDVNTDSFSSVKNAVEKNTNKPITENQSKKVKELTGKVKELKNTIEGLHKKFVDTIDNWAKEHTKSVNVNKAKKIIEGNKKEKGDEADLIFQSAKRDYVAARVAKDVSRGKSIDDSVDEISKEGLIKPENVEKAKEYFKDLVGDKKEPMTAEEKNIKRLEKKLQDLKEGIKKDKSEQREKSDAEKELERQIQDEKDKQLVQSFAGKTDTKFTPDEVKNIWDYAKRNYVDKGENINNIIRKTGIDLGLSSKQVLMALDQPKGAKTISTKMFALQNRRAEVQNKVKDYIRTVNRPQAIKFLTAIPHFFFQKAIALHGTVGFITHAGLHAIRSINVFKPDLAKIYWPLFFKQFKNSFGGLTEKGLAEYENSMQFLRDDPLFWVAKQAGVKVDPSQVNDDYAVVKKMFGNLGTMGDRGFNTLKEFRMAYFTYEYNRLSDAEKSDPETLKRIGQLVNHGTGTSNFKPSELLNVGVFAPRLEASKWARILVDPAKALGTFSKMAIGKDVTLAEKAGAKIVVRKSAEFLGAYMTALAINQSMLYAAGSNQSINIADPTKKDWLKFKAMGSNIDVSGGIIPTLDFIGHLLYLPFESNKQLAVNEHQNRSDAFTKIVSNYSYSKLSPFAGTAKDVLTTHDYNGNTMPWSDDKPKNKYAHNLTWKEYLWSDQAPIFIASGAQSIYESMKDRGMSDVQINDVLTGIIKGAIEGGTGTHVSPDYSTQEKASGGGSGASGGFKEPKFKEPKFSILK